MIFICLEIVLLPDSPVPETNDIIKRKKTKEKIEDETYMIVLV